MMSYKQLDFLADLCDPVLVLGLVGAAFVICKKKAWLFLLRSVLAVGVVQQLSKLCQKQGVWGDGFPSTHFAVALALLTCFVLLNRKFWLPALGFAVVYGVLMLVQGYHTPLQMLGSVFAVPVVYLFHLPGHKAPVATN